MQLGNGALMRLLNINIIELFNDVVSVVRSVRGLLLLPDALRASCLRVIWIRLHPFLLFFEV